MPKSFDFFYDLGSPYSYLASTQLAGIEQRTHSKARLFPITLGGLRKATGHQLPPPQQLKYMSEDTGRWARQYGVPMQIPRAFPISTILALRSCIASEREGKGEEVMRALFRAYWTEGEDISQEEVVAATLSRIGLDGKALVSATQDAEIKNALRKNTDLALARGVFGVPTVFVGERSFWGNDRLQFAEAELRRER